MPALSIRNMLAAGLCGLRRYRGLWLSLYLLQFTIAGLVSLVIARILVAELGKSPLLDRAVDGEFTALIFVLTNNPDVWAAALLIGSGAVCGYIVLSWYLIGGANTVLLRQPGTGHEVTHCFGSGGAATFYAYFRLALWSLLLYLVTGAAVGVGLAIGGKDFLDALTGYELAGRLIPPLIPGIVLFWLNVTAVDYARIELSRRAIAAEKLSSLRALLGAYRAIFSDRRPLLHVLVYAGYFAGVSVVYVALVQGLPMAGAAGALALFVVRQMVLAVRFAGSVVCTAGQVALAGSPAAGIDASTKPADG